MSPYLDRDAPMWYNRGRQRDNRHTSPGHTSPAHEPQIASPQAKGEKETNMARANRVAVARTEQGTWQATFYKTHSKIATMGSEGFQPTADTQTGQREEFRVWATERAESVGVQWQPELQAQAWDRRYWKYETDEMVEEDAVELMNWTIQDLCKKIKANSKVENIVLDSIVPNECSLSYVEHGKYLKNGNWASATVNLEITLATEDGDTQIIYPIQMVSGQLKKIKLTKAEVEGMVADGMVA